ncbi:hypothetical protein OSB04_014977 [Centaurea solstitialis]|uniref:Reverse transcriptase zinc-binding domain-containing protein n=1 Tax=Centaurea solstitialis TaxID=347529 RepID=A0AA38TGD2_9ASTR|nr:hypothetical protein OSB04_014977 [Centaurea solstitialis]
MWTVRELREKASLGEGDEHWDWVLKSVGCYTISSLRPALDDMCLRLGGLTTMWNKIVPVKVKIHTWWVTTDRFPTKGVPLEKERCPLCNGGPETTLHVFVDCVKLKEVRRVVNA